MRAESAEIALSWVRAHAFEIGLSDTPNEDIMKNIDVHLHLPSGSIRKDGPSAGVAMVSSLVSLFSGKRIPSTLAMTGEITLRGNVTPVGGIKEKVLAAHRAGITKVILPYRNRKDIEADLPEKVRNEMEFAYVKTIWEVLNHVFGSGLWDESTQDSADVMGKKEFRDRRRRLEIRESRL